jgi:hypothetical protein
LGLASRVRSTALSYTGLQPGAKEYGENQVTVSTVSIAASECISMRLNDFTKRQTLKTVSRPKRVLLLIEPG